VRVGAVTASLGALLALLAGVGRTTLAMARERDLPGWLTSIDPVHRVPDHAQVVIAAVVVALVLVADLRQAIGFSSCGVLVYYAVANLAALRQPAAQRRSPRVVPVVGLVGCVVLVATLPREAVLGGLAVLLVGVVVRGVRLARER
jgi:APA family basic amino acid/polyamine antiporter